MEFYQIKTRPDQKTDFGKAYSNEEDAVRALLNHWAYETCSIHHSLVNASVDIVESKDVPEMPIGMVLLSYLDKEAYECKRYELYSESLGFNDTYNIAPKEALEIIRADVSNWFTAEQLHTLLSSKVNYNLLNFFADLAKINAMPYVFHKGSEPALLSWYPIDTSMSTKQIKDGIIPHQKRMLELYEKIRDKKIKDNPYVNDYGPGWEKRTRTIIGCKIPCNKHDITSWDGCTPIKIWVVDPKEVYDLRQDSNGKSKDASTMHTINFETIVDKDFPFSQITYDHNGYPIVHFFYLESVNFNLDFFSKDQQYAMALEKFNQYNTGTSNKWRNLI